MFHDVTVIWINSYLVTLSVSFHSSHVFFWLIIPPLISHHRR